MMNQKLPHEPEELTKPKLLLVEGNYDKRFLEAFIKYHNIEDIQVSSYGGKANLFKALTALPTRTGYNKVHTIGITRDADDDQIKNIFNHIKTQFNIEIPFSIGEVVASKPRIGVYFFPDCEKPGALEDLCLETIRTQPEMQCIENFFNCMSNINHIKKPEKTKLYAWLSISEKPPTFLGEAAESNYFDFGHSAFSKLTHFIKNL